MRINCLLLFIIMVSLSALSDETSSNEAKLPAKVVFEQLGALVGYWQTADPNSNTTIEMKLIANGSALVETWNMSPTKQSMTVYTMDGDRLLATHYCPQGNAPRLVYTESDSSGAHHFEFLDGVNLQNPDKYHEHAFSIRVEENGSVTRNEIYISNKEKFDPVKHKGKSETFLRLK